MLQQRIFNSNFNIVRCWFFGWGLGRVERIMEHDGVHGHKKTVHTFRDESEWEGLRAEYLNIYVSDLGQTFGCAKEKVHFVEPSLDGLYVDPSCLVGLVT